MHRTGTRTKLAEQKWKVASKSTTVPIATEPTYSGNLLSNCNIFMVPHNVQHWAQAILMRCMEPLYKSIVARNLLIKARKEQCQPKEVGTREHLSTIPDRQVETSSLFSSGSHYLVHWQGCAVYIVCSQKQGNISSTEVKSMNSVYGNLWTVSLGERPRAVALWLRNK